jgi:hypothetical protein
MNSDFLGQIPYSEKAGNFSDGTGNYFRETGRRGSVRSRSWVKALRLSRGTTQASLAVVRLMRNRLRAGGCCNAATSGSSPLYRQAKCTAHEFRGAGTVIAIENARLLNELRERTDQLEVQSKEVVIRYPRGKPLISSNSSAGQSTKPAAISVLPPISKKVSAPRTCRRAASLFNAAGDHF